MSLYPRLYDAFLAPFERVGLVERRRRLLAGLEGIVLEVGVGTGLNLVHYPQAAAVVGVDARLDMLRRARRRRRGGERLVCARAEALPFSSDTFDAAVATLVLCSLEDPVTALQDVRSTLRPGAQLCLIEHVRWDRHPWLARLQDWLTPVWKRLADGCHLNRDTETLLERCGFRVLRRREDLDGLLVELRTHAEQASGVELQYENRPL